MVKGFCWNLSWRAQTEKRTERYLKSTKGLSQLDHHATLVTWFLALGHIWGRITINTGVVKILAVEKKKKFMQQPKISSKLVSAEWDEPQVFGQTAFSPFVLWDFTTALVLDIECTPVHTLHLAVESPQRLPGPPQLWLETMVYGDPWCLTICTMFSAFIETQLSCRKQQKMVFFYWHSPTPKYQIAESVDGLSPNVWFFFKKIVFGSRKLPAWGLLSSIPRNRKEKHTGWVRVAGKFHKKKKFNRYLFGD